MYSLIQSYPEFLGRMNKKTPSFKNYESLSSINNNILVIILFLIVLLLNFKFFIYKYNNFLE